MIYTGFVELPWWGYIITAFLLTHVTIAAVTIYLHRNIAHRSLELHPSVSHFFRFWLWFTTGMVTREWAAIHRKHHAKVETPEDPHSPQIEGILSVLFGGLFLYQRECKNRETIERYGFGAPDDWVERKLYTPHNVWGITLMLAINVALFGDWIGLAIWGVQMVWIPFWAAGVVNGVGHYVGYRNFQSEDESRNIIPFGLLIGGEELHNNHHAFPTSAKLSNKWYEFDLGWLYIRVLNRFGLVRIKRVAPKLISRESKPLCDLDTLNSVLQHRFEVVSRFAKALKSTCISELDEMRGKSASLPSAVCVRNWLMGMESRLSQDDVHRLQKLVHDNRVFAVVDNMRHELAQLWKDSEANMEQLIERLRNWCANAEQSGIEELREFARELRGFATVRKAASAA